ncbi:hypothetical protein [Salinisphaera sp. G21_0]|uniref:hypothetical protein n=1 Tax=Salinisphaera sp. G21_0 TaxID=2821094 RepID=UPI001ADA4F58|nr:hypothetical protein [Salinisphaera sp. G21_0]MBO9481590.1 hypothetical protein [Salinisphaera sp. G21_0]
MYRGKLFSDENSAVRRQTLRARTAEKLEIPYTLDSLTCFLALAIEEGWAEQKNTCRRAHGSQMTVIKLFLRQSVLTPLSAVAEDLYTTISEQLQHLFTTSVYDPFYFEFNDHNDHQRQLINGFFAHCELVFSGSLKLYGEWLTQARKIGLTKNTADDKAFLWSVFLTEAEKLESVLFDDDPKRTNSHPLILKLNNRMDDFKKYTGP